MLQLAAPRPGERLLELACGAGGVGIAAASPYRTPTGLDFPGVNLLATGRRP